MCGIAGLAAWWQSNERNGSVVAAMTETLHHRGPDAHGVWTAEHVALGHTRLAIVDIAGGQQPMVVRRPGAGEVCIVFSGEIYNHDELRAELQAMGHLFSARGGAFTTRSDTEVVLRAYLQWGEAFAARLVGMFAFAIWDTDEQALLLVRDRLGIKPLYMTQTGGDLAFASELKALLAHPGVSAEVDADGLGQLLAMVPMTTPGHAVLTGIEEVLPATIVRWDRRGVHQHRYWALEARPHQHDRLTTVDHVRQLLERAVREQSVADVPIGALCSGGLDSSAVAALAAEHLGGETLMTFDVRHTNWAATSSSSFHRSDDHGFAVMAAEHIGSEHITVDVSTDDLLAAHDATLRAMDLPSLSTINVSLNVLFERISQKRRVVLSGEGADEVFRGYAFHDLAGTPATGLPWANAYPPLTHLLNRDTARQVRPGRYARERQIELLEQMPVQAGETGPVRRLREIMWLTQQMYLPFLLRRKDRLSMASGVEVRVPYLDHRLVEYAWAIPAGWHRDRHMEKGLLRQAVAHMLPEQVAWRPKSGYPASLTLAYQAALWQRARDVLADPTSPVLALISPKMLRAHLAMHDGDLSDWTPLQHVSYVLEINDWLRAYRVRIR